MSAPSGINVYGTFLNMCNSGILVTDNPSEFVDNSFDVGATIVDIHILSKTRQVVVADNGCGMNKATLKTSRILNERSDATNTKQGRFGHGSKSAFANLTKMQPGNNALTISKTDCEEIPNQIEFKPSEIAKGNYVIFAHSCCRIIEHDYNRYVKDAFGTDSGTVHIITCDEEVFGKFRSAVLSPDITESYRYSLGVQFHPYIKNGRQIRIIVDDLPTFVIIPIDPLEMDKIHEEHKQVVACELFVDSNGEKCINIEELGWTMLTNPKKSEQVSTGSTKLKKTKESTSSTPLFNTSALPDSFTKITEFTHESAYSLNWAETQREIIQTDQREKDRFKPFTTLTKKTQQQKSDQNTSKHMGGRYFVRGDRTIDRMDKPAASGGDHASHTFTDKSRHRTIFSTEMDDYFEVEVNKSNIKYKNIHPDIRRICEFLEKRFANKLYAEYKSQQPQPEIMTKQTALEMLESINGYFEEHPNQVTPYVDRIIDVIINIGKSKPKSDEQQKMQWKIVSEGQNGPNIIIEVMTATIQSQKDGANIVGGEALKEILDNINAYCPEE